MRERAFYYRGNRRLNPSRRDPAGTFRPSTGRGAERDFGAANQGRSTRHTGWRKNGLSHDDRLCSRDKIGEGLACQRETDKSVIKFRLRIKFGLMSVLY